MKTITNISSAVVLQALRKAKPLTIAGRSAVENYKAWLVSNPMCAIALENSIASLTGAQYDPGLENLVSTLKGLMPESKRKVAVAYEALSMQNQGIFAAGNEAFDALTALYNMNAAKIIGRINDGDLDAFKTNPVIGKLIDWAKSAMQAKPAAHAMYRTSDTETADVTYTLVPILNLASVGDDMLVAIDGSTFIMGPRGSLKSEPNLADYDEVSDDVRAIVHCMSLMHVNPTEPNLIEFDAEVLDNISKFTIVKSFAIDIVAGINELVRINGEAMSVEKAKTVLQDSRSDLVAAITTTEQSADALRIINTAMDCFERYRGVLNSGQFANKFADKSDAVYIINGEGIVTMIQKHNGAIIDTKAYNTMFDVMTSEVMQALPAIADAASTVFADELKDDAKRMSVRQKIAKQLADERAQYEDLLTKINSELSNLEQVSDVNTDKVDALNQLKDKVAEKMATVIDELDKLSKA